MSDNSRRGASLIVGAIKQKIFVLTCERSDPQPQFLVSLRFSAFDDQHGHADSPLMSLSLVAGGTSWLTSELGDKIGRLELDEMLDSVGAVEQIRIALEILRPSFANINVSVKASIFFDDPRVSKPDEQHIGIDLHLGMLD